MNAIFQHILVVQQHTAEDALTLAKAVHLAKQYQSKITVFKSVFVTLRHPSTSPNEQDDDLSLLVNAEQNAIAEQLADLAMPAQQITIVISWREAEKMALEHLIAKGDFSLLLIHQHKSHGIKELFFNRLEHYLINDCQLPVWFVKHDQLEQDLHVLACLDVETPHKTNDVINHTILDVGHSLSHSAQGLLQVVNCYCKTDFSMSMPYQPQVGFTPLPDISIEQQQKLTDYLQQHHLSKRCLKLLEGLPDDEIPKMAQEQHSHLAIIGNNHMHTMVSAIWGDTAHYLAKHTPCDVLVVKPEMARPQQV